MRVDRWLCCKLRSSFVFSNTASCFAMQLMLKCSRVCQQVCLDSKILVSQQPLKNSIKTRMCFLLVLYDSWKSC